VGVDRGGADEPFEGGRVDRAAGGALEQGPRREEVGLDLDRGADDPVGEGGADLWVPHRLDRAVGEAVLVEELDPQVEEDRAGGEREDGERGAEAGGDAASG
jgi:hypothetical protein